MLTNYGYIALFLIAAILFAIVTILLPYILRLLKVVPKKPHPVKEATYECGMETTGRSWVQFNFRFYIYALMLIVLDVLVVFLYPWAVQSRELHWPGLIAALFFIGVLVLGLVYDWKKGALDWE